MRLLLSNAHTPFAILGGSGWTPDAADAFRRFAERFDLPVATSFRRAPLFAATHDNYAGELGINPNPKLKAHIAAADLGGIRCPSLIICGDHDMVSIEHTVLIYRSIPGARLWVVPRSGHATLQEHPAEFVRNVDAFFSGAGRERKD